MTLDTYRFLDPYRCSAKNIPNESDYLTEFIERVELESFVFLPYHQGFDPLLYYIFKNIYVLSNFVLVDLDCN